MERVPSLPEVLTKPLSVKLESLGMEAEVVAVKVPMVAFPIEEVAATVPVNWIKVVVAFARRPPQVPGVQAKVPLPPQAEPVLERRPIVEKVAQPAVPPAEETMRLVVGAGLGIARSVVVAAEVVE